MHPNLIRRKLLQHASRSMSQNLHPHLLRPARPFPDLVGKLGCDVSEAGAQFAVEREVGLLGEVGGHEVVGACEVVEVFDGEGVVGALVGFPDWVAEWVGGWCWFG